MNRKRNTHTKPLIIDIIGFPGSGKTVLMQGIAERLKHKGFAVRTRLNKYEQGRNGKNIVVPVQGKSRIKKAITFGYYCFAMLPLVVALIKLVRKQKKAKKNLTMINLKRCIQAYGDSRYNRSGRYSFIIYDTSPTHLLIPYFYSGSEADNDSSITEVIALTRRPHLLIVLNADIPLLLERLQKRSRVEGKYELMDRNTLEYFYKEYYLSAARVIEVCKEQFNIKAINVEAKESVENIITIVESELDTITSQEER